MPLYALALAVVPPLLLRPTTPASCVRLVGSHVNKHTSLAFHTYQEEEELSPTSDTLVMASYVQRSTVLARRRGEGLETALVQDPTTFPFLRADLAAAPHTSSCGHVMHAACWQKYFDDVSESERRRYR